MMAIQLMRGDISVGHTACVQLQIYMPPHLYYVVVHRYVQYICSLAGLSPYSGQCSEFSVAVPAR
jgi:hypothetical protein